MTHFTFPKPAVSARLVCLAVLTGNLLAAGSPPLNLNPDQVTIHPRTTIRLNVLANDSTSAGELLPSTISIETSPKYGTAVVENDGRILYTHTDSSTEADTFTYQVKDSGGNSGAAPVLVSFSKKLRLPNLSFNVPADPPSNSAYQMVDAFPGLSFVEPVCVNSPSGDPKALFILEKSGNVKVIRDVTAQSPSLSVFLDLKEPLKSRNEKLSVTTEQGLLGLAFHPKYQTNGQFFLFYSVTKPDGKTYERVSRFTRSNNSPLTADPASEVVFLEQYDRAGNHQGSCLAFGPDGYLYISVGDEGGQNDQYKNGQLVNQNFFSGILRIDVDKAPSNLDPNPHPSIPLLDGKAAFRVPFDNPFIHRSQGGSWDGSFNGVTLSDLTKVRTEFWATGLRNPWRMSFDKQTGELWVGDVGGELYEEIDLVQKGGNYGWPYREGFESGVRNPLPEETTFASLPPIAAYPHGTGPAQGNSVTGGVVVRGGSLPALEGAYLYSDFLSGNVWALRRPKGEPVQIERLFSQNGISAFGTDPATGDVLAADYTGSRLLRLVAAKEGAGFPQKLSDTRLFVKTADLSPSRGLLPYEINHPAWNDGATSRRWFAYYATEDGQKIKVQWANDGTWKTPLGTLWVQHLDLELEQGHPESKRRIETRLLVRNNSGAYGVTYRWNEEQTDATLVPETGEDTTLLVKKGSETLKQPWHFPGQAECMICHTNSNGNALSFSTRQMNRESIVPGFTGNQIDPFFEHNLFPLPSPKTNPPPSPKAVGMPKFASLENDTASLEDRARSYLAVNCAICHQPGGMAPTAWNVRPEVPLEQTSLLNTLPLNNGGDIHRKLLVPKDTAHSLILTRMQATDGFTRMPLAGPRTTDERAVNLLKAWIDSLQPTGQANAQ